MWKYVLQRIGLIFLTTFIILSLTFILMKTIPMELPLGGSLVQKAFFDNQVKLGYMYVVTGNAKADYTVIINNIEYKYSLYSIMHQYGVWLGNIVTKWDWGTSTKISVNVSAISIIGSRIGVSMKLNIIALLFSLPLGFFFGITSALKKNSAYDNIVQTVVMIAVSIPSFVLISYIVLLFGFNTGWLPTTWPTSQESVAIRIKGYIIPVTCLCFGTVASFTRYMRAELTEVMSSEFLLLARTKGLTKNQMVLRHALRNSMVPIVPMIIGEFIGILSGSMILEQIYAIPGIGFLFVTALSAKDYNVVMVDMACYTLIDLFAILLVDISYGVVDPRIRMGAVK
jgi:oligopeptide transport system permease protein